MSTLSTREMRTLEINAEYLGISPIQLMENAGAAVAREIKKRFSPTRTVVVYAGIGGNGGDGMVTARHLAGLGFDVTLILVGDPVKIRNEATRLNWEIIKRLGSSVNSQVISDSSMFKPGNHDIIVDALVGIGIKGELKQPLVSAIKVVEMSTGFKISVDIASGMEADTGETKEEFVNPNLTITFHALKTGMKDRDEILGEIAVADIGIPPEAEEWCGPGDLLAIDQSRPPNSHKGMFGRLLVIGGSETYSGAPLLVGQAAMRTGIDLVYIAAPKMTGYVIASMSPNIIVRKMKGKHLNPGNLGLIETLLKTATGIVIGPGLGLHKETAETCKRILDLIQDRSTPILLDADALKAFKESELKPKSPTVLTPHSGEYRILTGEKPPEDLDSRIEHVKRYAKKIGATILLKGSVDIISDGTKVKLNHTGNPGMTVGGTGDTLSGIVGAFLSRDTDPFMAASCGAFVNGAAGDLAVSEKGYHIVATDIINHIPRVLEEPMSHLEVR
jgi:NAD(P)H-hydrate epimerase